jgi:hypothetical protein
MGSAQVRRSPIKICKVLWWWEPAVLRQRRWMGCRLVLCAKKVHFV